MFFLSFGALVVYFSVPLMVPGQRYSENGVYASLAIGVILGCVMVVWITHRFVPLICKDA
jgi:hypothetical protein